MNMTDIPWELLLDHEAKLLMEIDPNQEVSNKKSQQGRLAIACRLIQVLKEFEKSSSTPLASVKSLDRMQL